MLSAFQAPQLMPSMTIPSALNSIVLPIGEFSLEGVTGAVEATRLLRRTETTTYFPDSASNPGSADNTGADIVEAINMALSTESNLIILQTTQVDHCGNSCALCKQRKVHFMLKPIEHPTSMRG